MAPSPARRHRSGPLKSAEADNKDVPSDQNADEGEALTKFKDQKATLESRLPDKTKDLHQFLVENDSVRSKQKEWKQKPDERQGIGSKHNGWKVEIRAMMMHLHDPKEQLQAAKRQTKWI